MRRRLRTTRWVAISVVLGCAVLATVLTAATPAAVDRAGGPAAHRCLVMTGSGDPAFVKNFNPYTATGLPSGSFVQGAFYEPLIITAEGKSKPQPWLARSFAWSNGNKTLRLNLAHGVKWSDGKALTSADVVYSLTAGRQDKIMDRVGLTGAANEIVSVKARGAYTLLITLKTADSQFISSILNRQFVVPKHVWSKVADAANYTNSSPVGSGPFNRLGRFTTQDYVLNKNPGYWRKGQPKIACIEYVQAASNDAALALIQSGQVDWTHNFVPNVEKAYVAKDKKHFHAFYAKTAYPISLILDTTDYPYSLAVFRKALSLAIDRKTVSKLGEYGYAPPTDAIGLNGLFPSWVTDPGVKKLAKQMAAYNPNGAKKLLTDAGFTYKSGKLIDPHGDAVKLDIHVISGWSDWVASNQIIILREPLPERVHSQGAGCIADRKLGALQRRDRDVAAQPVEGDAERQQAEADRDAAGEDLPPAPADRAALHRAAVVDLQHEVLPLLRQCEGLLRRPDLHDLPRQHPLVHPDLSGREEAAHGCRLHLQEREADRPAR